MSAAPVRFWKTAAPVCFLVCGWMACATAMEQSTDWFNRVWQVDDGLPAANVTGIAQTRDGYLWLGTQSGLARFDGVNFEVVPIPVGSPRAHHSRNAMRPRRKLLDGTKRRLNHLFQRELRQRTNI